MQKIEPNGQQSSSGSLVAANIEALRALFPEAFGEGGVKFEVLRQLLTDGGLPVDEGEERYGLSWHGKKRARQIALTPSLGTLRPCPDESVDWETTKNIVIEGDNLEVLKLLRKSYAGKVKLIYIDPPYNTGNDFVYPDDFADGVGNYLRITGQVGEDGGKITSNTESSGRFHTNWLNMMYPRLKAAKELLAANGSIFLTVDDGELSHVVDLLDEIFGEENRIAIFAWQKKYSVSNNSKGVASTKDHVVAYARSSSFESGLFPRDEESKARYVNPDNDARGPWKPVDYWNQASPESRPNLAYPIVNPNTGTVIHPEKKAWKFSREVHEAHVLEKRIWWGADGTNSVPALKLFLTDVRDGLLPHDWWPHEKAGHTDEAKKELDALFDGHAPFDTPKPLRLLHRIMQVGNVTTGDVVLDFFAGSGTTGHAVQSAGGESSASLRFILVQLPEPIPNPKFTTIAEITKERLRRAGTKIKAENKLFHGDTGFRVFKLDTSNLKPWDPRPDDLPNAVADWIENIRPGRTEQDLLYELLVKLGLDLCVPIEVRSIAGKSVHNIGAGTLMVCLDKSITRTDTGPLGLGLVQWAKQLNPAGGAQFVFRDSAFADDVAKTNLLEGLLQNLPGLSKEKVRSL